MWMGYQNKKGIGSVPDPFGAGTYTASSKRPALNSGLAMRDYCNNSTDKYYYKSQTDVILLDFSKAFDKVPYEHLILKL